MPRVEMELETPVPPERIRAALLDFSPARPQRWPGILPRLYEVYRVGATDADIREGSRSPLGAVWAKEHYDWSDPDVIRWTVRESNFCAPGSFAETRIEPTATGARLRIVWNRTPTTLAGRLMARLIVATRGAPVAASMRAGLKRLEEEQRAAPTG
jgi:hypothetical protein